MGFSLGGCRCGCGPPCHWALTVLGRCPSCWSGSPQDMSFTVRYQGPGGVDVTRTTTTYFDVYADPPPGTWTLTVSRSGFVTAVQSVVVEECKNTSIGVDLYRPRIDLYANGLNVCCFTPETTLTITGPDGTVYGPSLPTSGPPPGFNVPGPYFKFPDVALPPDGMRDLPHLWTAVFTNPSDHGCGARTISCCPSFCSDWDMVGLPYAWYPPLLGDYACACGPDDSSPRRTIPKTLYYSDSCIQNVPLTYNEAGNSQGLWESARGVCHADEVFYLDEPCGAYGTGPYGVIQPGDYAFTIRANCHGGTPNVPSEDIVWEVGKHLYIYNAFHIYDLLCGEKTTPRITELTVGGPLVESENTRVFGFAVDELAHNHPTVSVSGFYSDWEWFHPSQQAVPPGFEGGWTLTGD